MPQIAANANGVELVFPWPSVLGVPIYGNLHGYDFFVHNWPGTYTTCIYGWNASGTPGSDASVGPCADVTISGELFGNLDSATRAGSNIIASGGVIDPDTASPISVHIYVDGVWELVPSLVEVRWRSPA